jgi:hypothetical protein
VAHRDGGLPNLLAQPLAGEQLRNDRHLLVAVTIDLQRRERLDGFAFAGVANGVVALGRVHVRVAHQLGQRRPGRVPQHVRGDRPAEPGSRQLG